MKLDPAEPAAHDWNAISLDDLWECIYSLSADRGHGRPLIVAVDGRSASGKTTLAGELARVHGSATIIHADDLAWWEPLFGWDHLLRHDILEPLHAGQDVEFTPPQWRERGRAGSINVPATADVVVIEGVGASCASVADLLDVAIWVQSDIAEAERRGIARDAASGENGNYEETVAFWHDWGKAERAYLANDQPWHRAHIIVAGTPPMPLPTGMCAIGSL